MAKLCSVFFKKATIVFTINIISSYMPSYSNCILFFLQYFSKARFPFFMQLMSHLLFLPPKETTRNFIAVIPTAPFPDFTIIKLYPFISSVYPSVSSCSSTNFEKKLHHVIHFLGCSRYNIKSVKVNCFGKH